MKESQLERKLVHSVTRAGGLALKFTSPGMAGVPDRLILLPQGRIAFAELKVPGKKPRPLQLHRHARLRALGFKVYVIDHPDQIQEVLHDLRTT